MPDAQSIERKGKLSQGSFIFDHQLYLLWPRGNPELPANERMRFSRIRRAAQRNS
jgi:hypothetical protein